MSGLVLPSYAPEATRRVVVESLAQLPGLVRFLDTPGLLAWICLEASAGPDRRRLLEEAIEKPHRRLVEEAGFVNLRQLRRLSGDALNHDTLSELRVLSRSDHEAVRRLQHAEIITPTLISALHSPVVRECAAKSLLIELGKRPRRRGARFSRIFEVCSFLNEYRPQRRLRSVAHLRRVRREYGRLLLSVRDRHRRPPRIPAPPFPDEPGYAIGLRTWRDMIQESVEMRNCCGWSGEILSSIEKGEGYLYRIEANWGMPRASMYIVKQSGDWRIDAAERASGQPLDAMRMQCLAVWLAEKQQIADESRCMPERKAVW